MSNNQFGKRKGKFNIGKLAIPRLPLIMTGCFIAGYIFCYFFESFYPYLLLDPAKMIGNHQYWRLITWIFTVPFMLTDTFSYILAPIALYFYYFVGTQLENVWGRQMLNLYVFGNILLTDIAVIVTYFIDTTPAARETYAALGGTTSFILPVTESTRYMLLAMFLALAVIFKEQVVLFAFVVPMKMKWMAVIDAVFMLYEFIKFPYLYSRVVIIVCVVTFGIFFLINMKRTGRTIHQIQRSRQFKRAYESGKRKNETHEVVHRTDRGNVITMRPKTKGPIHQCAVCGRTEQDNEDLEFRYCSKCNGNYEYCSDHIFTHVHKE